MQLETFKVEGMNAHKYREEVENALANVEGVSEVRVDIETERATVEFDQDKVNLDTLKDEVRAEGYEIK